MLGHPVLYPMVSQVGRGWLLGRPFSSFISSFLRRNEIQRNLNVVTVARSDPQQLRLSLRFANHSYWFCCKVANSELLPTLVKSSIITHLNSKYLMFSAYISDQTLSLHQRITFWLRNCSLHALRSLGSATAMTIWLAIKSRAHTSSAQPGDRRIWAWASSCIWGHTWFKYAPVSQQIYSGMILSCWNHLKLD